MKQIGQHELLSFEDEVDLARQYRAGKLLIQERERLESELGREPSDSEVAKCVGKSVREVHQIQISSEDAKTTLISANMRLVFHIARYYKHRGVSYTDLIQEGTVGLMKAVEKYDPSRGFRFSTYASWWVKQAVSRAIAEQSRIVRIPVHIHDLLCTLHKVETEFIAEHDRSPSTAELATLMSLPVEKIELLEKCSREVKSMDDSISIGSSAKAQKEFFLGDRLLSDNSPLIDQDHDGGRARLKFLVDRKLFGREAAVVDMRYGLTDGVPMTLEQVGKKLNVTRERIRQIETKAIAKLRENDLSGEMKEIFQDPRVTVNIETGSSFDDDDDAMVRKGRKSSRVNRLTAEDFFLI